MRSRKIASSSNPEIVAISLFEEEKDFIDGLKSATGKSLPEWFDRMAGSRKTRFLDLRKWLTDQHKLDTATATTLARLYLEDFESNAPKVWFYTEGKGGDFQYQGPEGGFMSYWEWGSGDAVSLLFVPTETQWETRTRIPLAKRLTVLEAIGKKAVEQHATDGKGSYAIRTDCIIVYS